MSVVAGEEKWTEARKIREKDKAQNLQAGKEEEDKAVSMPSDGARTSMICIDTTNTSAWPG